MNKINSPQAAQTAFCMKFAQLLGSEFCASLEFTKHAITIHGQDLLAYVASDEDKDNMFVIPLNTQVAPSIEKYNDVSILQNIRSADDALKAFSQAFGWMSRVADPSHPDYNGYKFQRKLIRIRNSAPFEAFVAANNSKQYAFVVPEDGASPKIETYSDITIIQ